MIHQTTRHIKDKAESVIGYIFEAVPSEEFFKPKVGRNPDAAKRRDARGARRQDYYWRGSNIRDVWDEGDFGLSKNGIPYVNYDGRTHYLVAGYHRPKSRWFDSKHYNGKVEGFVKAFKPELQGKNSRVRMRLQSQWWREAIDALETQDESLQMAA